MSVNAAMPTVGTVRIPASVNLVARVTGISLLIIALSVSSLFAQTPGPSTAPQQTQDPSALRPAPSTLQGAFADSLRLLLVEHTTRIAFQSKTRRELGGPFFSDYLRSLRVPVGRR